MKLTQERIDACRREEGKVFGLMSSGVQETLKHVRCEKREVYRGDGWWPDPNDETPPGTAFRLKANVVADPPWVLTQEMIDECASEDHLPFGRKSPRVREILELVGWNRREIGSIDWKNDSNTGDGFTSWLYVRIKPT